MIASKQHRKHALIFNQNLLDFFSSLFLIITYAVKLCNIYLAGLAGYLFCVVVVSENLVWCVILASKANIIFVTIERYLNAVFPIWSKKNLHQRMIYAAITFSWISGFVHIMALTFSTSDVIDGVCYAYVIWKSRTYQLIYGIWYFLAYYAVELFIFIFCYGHILIAILLLLVFVVLVLIIVVLVVFLVIFCCCFSCSFLPFLLYLSFLFFLSFLFLFLLSLFLFFLFLSFLLLFFLFFFFVLIVLIYLALPVLLVCLVFLVAVLAVLVLSSFVALLVVLLFVLVFLVFLVPVVVGLVQLCASPRYVTRARDG